MLGVFVILACICYVFQTSFRWRGKPDECLAYILCFMFRASVRCQGKTEEGLYVLCYMFVVTPGSGMGWKVANLRSFMHGLGELGDQLVEQGRVILDAGQN